MQNIYKEVLVLGLVHFNTILCNNATSQIYDLTIYSVEPC